MSLRGFSAFEARFRAKMAQSAPTDVLVKKRIKDGLTQKEIDDYRITFRFIKIWKDAFLDARSNISKFHFNILESLMLMILGQLTLRNWEI